MRKRILVNLLNQSTMPVPLAEIARAMDFSEGTIRNLIKEVNCCSPRIGCSIQSKWGKGYILDVSCEDTLKEFLGEEAGKFDVYDVNQRIEMLIFHLLQANGHMTIAELMDYTAVSRSTVLKDLKVIEEKLAAYDLKVSKKPHYGLKIVGSERSFRKAFYKHVWQSSLQLEPSKEFLEILKAFEVKNLEEYLREVLTAHGLLFSEVVFENLLTHLKIVLYRVSHNKLIKKDMLYMQPIEVIYEKVAHELAEWINKELGVFLPEEEIQFLGAHIGAKTNSMQLDGEKKTKLIVDLHAILNVIDEEFMTNFSQDDELIEGLILHIYPLLNRLYYNMQLKNPLIEELDYKYTNVFVVSVRIGELIEKKYGFKLTKDEIGYIALHLETHFEREKQAAVNRVKRIVVICATGGGSAHLIRLKLESIFPKALIMTISQNNVEAFREDLPDLFLSTIPIGEYYLGVPIIHIKHFLDDFELRNILDKTAMHISEKQANRHILNLLSLFSKNYFEIHPSGDYLEIINSQANKMMKEGVASETFLHLVLEREGKFSTIYDKGIAGPHPIKLNANVNTIGVNILREPIRWQDKEVQIIFLINLKQGNLFLHKEISKLLITLMENAAIRTQILETRSFENFINIIEQMV